MRALVLDFDGIVMDTETTDFESWRVLYAHFGVELPREDWRRGIGTEGGRTNPGAALSEATGVSERELRERRREVRDDMVAELGPLPGVTGWLAEAGALGLSVAIASSSPSWWVEGHLKRVGLRHHISVMATADDVERVKPAPAVYRLALERLSVSPAEAIAVEDSPNGMAAALAAGIRCVAVPGPMTLGENFEGAYRVLNSLRDISLDAIVRKLRAAA